MELECLGLAGEPGVWAGRSQTTSHSFVWRYHSLQPIPGQQLVAPMLLNHMSDNKAHQSLWMAHQRQLADERAGTCLLGAGPMHDFTCSMAAAPVLCQVLLLLIVIQPQPLAPGLL
jgi:hypothetical protein